MTITIINILTRTEHFDHFVPLVFPHLHSGSQICIFLYQSNAQQNHRFDNIYPPFQDHWHRDHPNQEGIDTRIRRICWCIDFLRFLVLFGRFSILKKKDGLGMFEITYDPNEIIIHQDWI